MQRLLVSAVSAVSLTTACGTAQVLTVIPNGFAAVEGSGASSSLFQPGAASLQAYYSEAFLAAAGITPGVVINGIAYRRNTGGTTGPAADTNFADYRILLSQSVTDAASMTTTLLATWSVCRRRCTGRR